jgi:hypothetical protein
MNTLIESIDLTYKYLCSVYELTRFDEVKKKVVTAEKHKGHNLTTLVKLKLLTEYKNSGWNGALPINTYKWNGAAPTYALAYNYYHEVRGSKKRYDDLLEILNNTLTHTAEEILEAISIKGLHEQNELNGIDINNLLQFNGEKAEILPIEVLPVEKYKAENKIEDSIKEILLHLRENQEVVRDENIAKPEVKQDVNPDDMQIRLETISKQLVELKTEINDIKSIKKDFDVVVEIMNSIINTTIDNTEKIKNAQNSISTIIAVVKTNQDNLYDISATQYHMLKEMYLNLVYLSKGNPDEYDSRRKSIGVSLEHMRKRVDINNELINRYGSNGKK